MARVERGLSAHLDSLFKPSVIKYGLLTHNLLDTGRERKRQSKLNLWSSKPLTTGPPTQQVNVVSKREDAFNFPDGIFPLTKGIPYTEGHKFISDRGRQYEVVCIDGHWGQKLIGHVDEHD